MRLQDYGVIGDAKADSFFKQILDWSRNKISFQDNFAGKIMPAYIGTAETIVQHALGRVPQGFIEVGVFPNGTAGVSFTKAPTETQLYLKRTVAGACNLLVF